MPEVLPREVIAQKFEADQAGQLVGWVNVIEREETELITAAVAYARISDQGAAYGTMLLPNRESDEIHDTYPIYKGFEHSNELVVAVRDGEVVDARASRQSRRDKTSRGPGTFALRNEFANSFFPGDGDPNQDGVWAVGDQAITEAIKAELEKLDVGWMYPTIYYYLSQMAHVDIQLGDPTMRQTTQQEIHIARDHRQLLELSVEEDDSMLGDLTVFGNVKADDIPARFRESRRVAAENERKLTERQSEFLHRWQMPIGGRPAGRSWPYMDASEPDETKAFGWVLESLEARSVHLASLELKREVEELNLRIKTADTVLKHLGALANREKELEAS